jgi:hypothetical protein
VEGQRWALEERDGEERGAAAEAGVGVERGAAAREEGAVAGKATRCRQPRGEQGAHSRPCKPERSLSERAI